MTLEVVEESLPSRLDRILLEVPQREREPVVDADESAGISR
jgi:hypothetical protein